MLCTLHIALSLAACVVVSSALDWRFLNNSIRNSIVCHACSLKSRFRIAVLFIRVCFWIHCYILSIGWIAGYFGMLRGYFDPPAGGCLVSYSVCGLQHSLCVLLKAQYEHQRLLYKDVLHRGEHLK